MHIGGEAERTELAQRLCLRQALAGLEGREDGRTSRTLDRTLALELR